jgi:hypothetical protein
VGKLGQTPQQTVDLSACQKLVSAAECRNYFLTDFLPFPEGSNDLQVLVF